MANVTLVPMTFGEFDAFKKATIENYSAEVARAFGISQEQGRREAEGNLKDWLPQGLETPGHYFIKVMSMDGVRIGSAWFGLKKTPDARGHKRGYVYDIEIDPNFQGQGYGESTLREIEERARQMGCGQIGLNVFGHNTRARSLYEKLGYRSAAIAMCKDLD